MKTFYIFLIALFITGCNFNKSGNLILIKGGECKNHNSNLYNSGINIKSFYIGKYEVTQKEWKNVMPTNPSKFKGDSLPVENVDWYECIEYCNKRSVMEGFEPYYEIIKNQVDTSNNCVYDSIKWIVNIVPNSKGYRLPSEVEWEYAASGGQESKNYIYSGSNNIMDVAWYWENSGIEKLSGTWTWPLLERNKNTSKPVGCKKSNELGLYDMSGNVREWCEDWYVDNTTLTGLIRSQRGGGWMGSEYNCKISFRNSFEPVGKGSDQGLRVCRSY